MVKKHIFRFLSLETPVGVPDKDNPQKTTQGQPMPTLRQSLLLNDYIHMFLRSKKNCIGEFYKNKKWDKFKKFANDYELIFTSSNNFPSVSSYQAISRSFFKLWEMLYDFEPELQFKTKSKVRAAFLAEGPGGFLEAFARYRGPDNLQNDDVFGITLISVDKNIPNWKIPKDITDLCNIQLLTGADTTGSLYNLANIDNFAERIGESSLDLVTSDGGFDFSTDFNNQEDLSTHLIVCEMYTALRLQAPGGAFVLKIYDIHTSNTMRLLWILKSHYQEVYIVKPLSSRPANSEKYVLAMDFMGHRNESMYSTLLNIIKTRDMHRLESIHVPATFVHQIAMYNVMYICKQVMNIHRTLTYIQTLKSNQNELFQENLRHQLKKSIKWCHKYKINVSIDAMRIYKSTYHL